MWSWLCSSTRPLAFPIEFINVPPGLYHCRNKCLVVPNWPPRQSRLNRFKFNEYILVVALSFSFIVSPHGMLCLWFLVDWKIGRRPSDLATVLLVRNNFAHAAWAIWCCCREFRICVLSVFLGLSSLPLRLRLCTCPCDVRCSRVGLFLPWFLLSL